MWKNQQAPPVSSSVLMGSNAQFGAPQSSTFSQTNIKNLSGYWKDQAANGASAV